MSKRVGKSIGRMIAAAAFVAEGYVWCDHGFLWALALYGACVLFFLAMWGAFNFPWGEKTA